MLIMLRYMLLLNVMNENTLTSLRFLENQEGHQNCRQNNDYSENDLYLCSMCIVYSSFYC